jgi:hypothetical protein
VKVNGFTQSGVTAGTFYTVNRTWNNNDTVTIDFQMTIKAVNQINGSVSIERGPLVYSLKLTETWTVRVAKTVSGLDFGEYEITPTNSWNYALVVDKNNPGANMTVNTATMPANPFIQSTTPITITAKAKKLTTWTMAANLLPNEVPSSPINAGTAEENVTLVPFGAENIRITYFPVVTTGSTARYEAESATVYNAQIRSSAIASNGQFVGGIDYTDSYVQFAVNVTIAGTYQMTIGYANGWSSASTHSLSVNGGASTAVNYPQTGAWAVFGTVDVDVNLNAGNNTIRLTKATNFAELDYINLTSTSGTPVPTPTPGPTATPTPTPAAFSDNFDDGNDTGWTKYGGTWSVVSGWYTVASDPGAKSVANGTNYANFTYQADVQISTSGSNNNAGLLFRVSNPSTGADAYNGYYAGLQNNRIVLGRANGSWTELSSYTMTISLNTTYHVKVEANGSSIKVYVTDMTTPKITYTDSTWTSGLIGIRTYACGAKVDNISVTSL